ncbi:MAG: hypothetical protein WCD37_09230 [Chloroflexia bacterium]
MLEQQRDDYYVASQRSLGCGFWLLWTFMTTVGGFVGQLIAQTGIHAFLPEDASIPTVMLALVPFGLVAGAVIGLAQGVLIFRYLKPAGLRDWVLASALGGVLRWALLGPSAVFLLLIVDIGIAQCNALIPLMLFGALSGAAFGIPQSFVLSRHLNETTELSWWSWTLAYAAGGLFYLPFVTLSGLTASALAAAAGTVGDEFAWRALIVVTLNWLITGLITALPIQDRLRHVNRPTYVEF